MGNPYSMCSAVFHEMIVVELSFHLSQRAQ